MNNLPAGVHRAICGSFNQTGIVCGSNNCYTVTRDGLTGTLPVTTYSHQYGGVVGFQNKAVIFGGNSATSYFTEEYDPYTNSWTVVNSQNAFGQLNYYYIAAVATGHAIYSFGGVNHKNQIFIMNTDYTWNLHPQTLITGRYEHKVMVNGKINVFLMNDS